MIKRVVPVSNFVRLVCEIRRIQYRPASVRTENPDLGEGYVPRMDVCEREGEILVELDMPGVRAEDMVILVHHNRLEVKGLKPRDDLPEGGTYLRVEREYGRFRRIIDLPASIQPDKAQASLRDGTLVITLRKAERGRGKP